MNLEIGNKAPAFQVNNQNGDTISLSQFTGKKIVLYFYPKDDTPGCTAEACDLRDNHHRFLEMDYVVLGVSPDEEKKHQKFITKYDLPFDLLSDVDHAVALAYGVWVEKSMYGKKYMGIARTTFIIDANGIIEDIIEKVDTKAHTAQILK
jgi:peroxiredoxin Q/BCP